MTAKPQTVIRSEKSKRSRFARIDNAVLQSRTLSFRARGILAYVLSKPDDWRHSAESLAANSNEGLHAIRSALRELSDAGHARLEKARDRGGHWVSGWTFSESPNTENRDPEGASPSAENRDSEGPPPSAGFPRVGQPDFGKPNFGEPNAGKPEPSETTVDITTVDQTTISKRECVGTPTLDELKSRFQEIDVDLQWREYARKYPQGGLRHFAEHWLPRAEPTSAEIRAAAKLEPKGRRASWA